MNALQWILNTQPIRGWIVAAQFRKQVRAYRQAKRLIPSDATPTEIMEAWKQGHRNAHILIDSIPEVAAATPSDWSIGVLRPWKSKAFQYWLKLTIAGMMDRLSDKGDE